MWAVVDELRKKEPTSDEDDINLPLERDELSRLRYRLDPDSRYGPRFGRGLKLYRGLLPSNILPQFDALMKRMKPELFKSHSALAKALKEISTILKVRGEGILWRFTEGIDRLGGYINKPNEELDEELRHWFSKKEKPEWFMKDFREASHIVVRKMSQNREVEYIAPIDYVRNIENWITSGSTSEKVGTIDGIKIPKTKTMLGYFAKTKRIYSLLHNWAPARHKGLPKRELSKVRAIVSSDMSTYLKMDYVAHWIEEDCRGSDTSPMFMGRNQQEDMWFNLSKRLPEVTFPLDQGNFDQNISDEMIIQIYRAWQKYYVPKYPFLYEWFEKIIYAMKHGIVTLTDGTEIPWESGMPSGIRDTTRNDTTINYTQLMACMLAMKRLGFHGFIKKILTMGDDDDIRVKDKQTADFILNYYNEAGFEANPAKMFISETNSIKKSRDDFLRINIFWDQCVGPPARGINAVFWADPSNRTLPRGLERVESTVSSWRLLASRGCDLLKTKKHMKKDLQGMLDLGKKKIERLLKTPRSQGGLGMFPSFNMQKIERLYFEVERTADFMIDAPEYLTRFWDRKKRVWASALGDWGTPLTKTTAYTKTERNNMLTIVNYSIGPEGLGLVPTWNRDVPTLNRELYIRDLIKKEKETGIDHIKQFILRKSEYDIIKKRARRSVFLDWLFGNIDYKHGVIWGVGHDTVDMANRNIARRIWGSLVRRGNANRTKLKQSYLFYEQLSIDRTVRFMNANNWRKSD
jgi:hypothetical protein